MLHLEAIQMFSHQSKFMIVAESNSGINNLDNSNSSWRLNDSDSNSNIKKKNANSNLDSTAD